MFVATTVIYVTVSIIVLLISLLKVGNASHVEAAMSARRSIYISFASTAIVGFLLTFYSKWFWLIAPLMYLGMVILVILLIFVEEWNRRR